VPARKQTTTSEFDRYLGPEPAARRARRRCRWGSPARVDPAAHSLLLSMPAAGSAKSSGSQYAFSIMWKAKPPSRFAAVTAGCASDGSNPASRPPRRPDDMRSLQQPRQTHALQFRSTSAGATFGQKRHETVEMACLAACVQSTSSPRCPGNRRCCSSLASPHLVP